ncbi:MAG TPA: DUF1643 domain-containing protein [Polyangia bacterium]|nr:DUF1643 domain-containing protein [Polyangia bacterium]
MTAALELFSERRWTVPASLSDDKQRDPYRYIFAWAWAPGPLVCYVGLNPSTMTALKTDATGRKWRGFAERMGCGGYLAVNAFALRSTDPKTLGGPGWDPVGPVNDAMVLEALRNRGVEKVVACWGRPPFAALKDRLREVRRLITAEREVHCWGLTADGEPKHPLTLSYETPLRRLEP